jgi:pSer/pThr/pTyr-binding forkhead associated (FHA) protein
LNRIRITVEGEVVHEVDLQGPLVIGRSRSADLQIADSEVSLKHGRLEPVGGAVQYRDLGSTNGSFLDDGSRLEPNRPVMLSADVKLVIGPALVEVVGGPVSDELPPESFLSAKTMAVDAVGADDLLVALARFKASNARLVIAAEHERRAIPIEAMETTVGRGPPAQVVVPHASVSSSHAELRFDDGDFVIEDLGSSNGTHVAGKKISRPTVLGHECALTIGTVECLFLHDEPQSDISGDDPYATVLADHVVSLRKATRLQSEEALEAQKRGEASLGEWFVVHGLLTPAEWVEIHGQRDVLHTLAAAQRGGSGGGSPLPWIVAALAVIAAAVATYMLVSGS